MPATLMIVEGDGDERRGFKVGWGYKDKPIVVSAYVGVDSFTGEAETADDVVTFLAEHGLALPEAALRLIEP